ncbi:MAG: hypothetical protein CM15mV102_240 [uncultured marine virus]|nr:MAG: hypothetical protein CM15mV102_240 [uncultured marine virus]
MKIVLFVMMMERRAILRQLKEVETTSGGATVTGAMTTTTLSLASITGNVRWPQDASGSSSRNWDIVGDQGAYGRLEVKYANARGENPNEKSARFIANGGVELYYNDYKSLRHDQEGVL